MSIIDSLGKGFSAVTRHWWVLLIPVLLDIFLWLGPQASVAALVNDMADVLFSSDLWAEMSAAGTGDPAAAEEPAAADSTAGQPGMADLTTAFREALARFAQEYNLFSMLRVRLLSVPSLVTWGGAGFTTPSVYEVLWVYFMQMIDIPNLALSVAKATFMTLYVWHINDGGIWLLVAFLVSLLGVLIGSIYLTLVAKSVSGELARGQHSPLPQSDSLRQAGSPRAAVPPHDQERPVPAPPFWTCVAQISGRVLLFWVIRALVVVVLGIPFFIFIGILGALSTNLALLVGMAVMGALTWLSFYGVFFVAALAINHVSLWQAIWNSVNVVLRNFWATLGLFLLINLIGGGLTILWQQLCKGTWLTLIGIVGNAYVGSGLLAGSLLFYQDRYTRWREVIARLIAPGQKQLL